MGCQKRYIFPGAIFLSLSLSLSANALFAGQHSVSTEVQANITVLQETKNCPGCNLSGAVLSRMDLSDANLQRANLSRAKMFLTNLSGANLQNSDLREAQFGGADLANADLRGANLAGASLAGAYMGGALLDGEMVITTPYVEAEIADIEETVYVEDTVKSKSLPETEEVTIGSRRDFEETPPSVPVEAVPQETSAMVEPITPVQGNDISPEKVAGNGIPEQSVMSPDAKDVPVIQDVRIQEQEEAPQVLHTDNTKKQLSQEETTQPAAKEETPVVGAQNQEEVSADLQEITEMEPVSKQETAVEVVATAPAVQVVSDDDQAEIQQEGDSMVSVQAKEEGDKTDLGESTGNSRIAGPEVVSTEMPETEITEEIAQANEGVQELEEQLSVHGPGSELFENIELLLDTNQCYGCNLAGANLSGKNLEDADLEGADLSNAHLQNADLEGANLKGANLSGADLSEADLSGADLYKAVLIDADLTNANLENTLLDDANLSGVKGYQETMLLLEDK